MVGVGAPGSAGALLFLVSALGDILGRFMTDWDWPKVLGLSPTLETTDTVDRPCGSKIKGVRSDHMNKHVKLQEMLLIISIYFISRWTNFRGRALLRSFTVYSIKIKTCMHASISESIVTSSVRTIIATPVWPSWKCNHIFKGWLLLTKAVGQKNGFQCLIKESPKCSWKSEFPHGSAWYRALPQQRSQTTTHTPMI